MLTDLIDEYGELSTMLWGVRLTGKGIFFHDIMLNGHPGTTSVITNNMPVFQIRWSYTGEMAEIDNLAPGYIWNGR